MPSGTRGIGLIGLDLLGDTCADVAPGETFRPADPREEALAQVIPSGLQAGVEEDSAGVEQRRPFRAVVAARPVTAVDAGVVKLGVTPDGLVGAVRAAAVTHLPDGRVVLHTCRPGIFALNSRNRRALFHAMGRELGKPDFYVSLDEAGRPIAEKVRLGPHDHRLLDRVRSYVERLLQRYLAGELEDGLLVLDGALTLRTFDTPQVFLRGLEATCQARRLSLVAVAKQTGLTVRGVDIRLLLDGEGGLPGRRKLTRAVRAEQGQITLRALGDLYVARFAPGGQTYRVDIDPEPGLISAEVLDEFAAACLHRNGYPEPLVEAHAFSYMAPPIVAQLQAHAVAQHGLQVRPEPNLGPVFAPFGGRYK
jgi:hypothetical protein